MSFKDKFFCQHSSGKEKMTIRFIDLSKLNGIGDVAAKTAYSYKLSCTQRNELARRITAALNYISDMETEQVEDLIIHRIKARAEIRLKAK